MRDWTRRRCILLGQIDELVSARLVCLPYSRARRILLAAEFLAGQVNEALACQMKVYGYSDSTHVRIAPNPETEWPRHPVFSVSDSNPGSDADPARRERSRACRLKIEECPLY